MKFTFKFIPEWVKMVEHKHKSGQLILEPFGENHHLYILAEGSATVYNYGLKGEVLNVYDYDAVDYFGEVELLCGRRYPLMVQAKTNCTTLMITQADFFAWLRQDVDFSLYIMRRLSEKLLDSSDKLVRFSMMDLRQRYLITIYSHNQAGMLPTVTKTQVAEEICTPMRSLNRMVAQNLDLVGFKNKMFYVIQEKALAKECGEIQELLWHKNS